MPKYMKIQFGIDKFERPLGPKSIWRKTGSAEGLMPSVNYGRPTQ